jgi:hypothetical protein
MREIMTSHTRSLEEQHTHPVIHLHAANSRISTLLLFLTILKGTISETHWKLLTSVKSLALTFVFYEKEYNYSNSK